MYKPGISIVIPTWNEARNIKSLIKSIVLEFIQADIPYEILVIDDHSVDETRRIVQACSKHYPVRFVEKRGGVRGKGYSILEGYRESIYEYIALVDADMEPGIEYLRKLYDLALKSGFACARLRRTPIARALSLKRPCQGPKIFKREIFEHLDTRLVNKWYIEKPLIITGRELGFEGSYLDLAYKHVRRNKSFLEKVSRVMEIGKGIFLSNLFGNRAYTLKPDTEDSMVGAGVAYKRQRFVTHTTLPVHLSALTTFAPWQSLAILIVILIVATGLTINTRATLITLTATLSLIYLLDVIFNFYVTLKSLHFPPELSITDDEIAKLKDKELPLYSVLCPLYKEARVLPQFVAAMSALDYPKNKLEVILLLEEDDIATIEAAKSMDLPSYFRTLIVPHSAPKTKPKACNYGLAHANGEYIVIYDAEDKPELFQLKRAYLAFKKSSPKVACLQAKLNYYNPHHNLLTRLFTTEYSLWFDVILPGLQSIKTTIPLGGTSNHFRREVLRNLQGWDPFNVTEDADLGTRLFSAGYQTAIIDSTTLEEANSNWKNWFRQRSRWLKGYMQTYLVHMRHPLDLLRKHGWHAFIFNLVIGGKIAFILINPLLWAMTISYFVLNSIVGGAIEAIYPGPVFYMAATSLVLGNFIALYNYMIGAAKRGHYDLIKYVFAIPLYWLSISGAACVAFFQLIFKPHYWEKTIHGLHILHEEKEQAKLASRHESRNARARRVARIADLLSSSLSAGGIMVIASVVGNFLNFLYTSFLGRNLKLEDFGAINLFGSLLMVTQVPIGALARTVTHQSAFLLGKYGKPIKELWLNLRKRSFYISLVFTVLWLLSMPLLKTFFHFETYLPFILFAPVWFIGTLAAVDGGFLGGSLMFSVIAILTVTEALGKFGISFLLVHFGFHEYVYMALPLSMSIGLLLGWYYVKRMKPALTIKKDIAKDLNFRSQFFFTSIITSLTSLAYTTMDVVLAKHYLSPTEAGTYSYLSLAGKMVYLASGMFSQFVIPYASRDLGEGKKGRAFLRRMLLLVSGANILAFIVFGWLGYITAPLLWGAKASGIIPYLIPYTLAMSAYSISSLIVSYRQVRGEYLFSFAGFFISAIQVIAIVLNHDSVGEISESVVIASVFSIVIMALLDRFYGTIVDIYHAILDFIGLFRPLPASAPLISGKLRILIFNWRDLRHVWAGGAEVYIHELAKRWVKMGNEVTIFAGNDGHDLRHEKIDGVRIIRRGGFYLVYIWAFLYYHFRFKGRYDVIIDSENGLPFFTPLYAKEKVFLLIHHVHQEVFRLSLRPPFSWLASWLEKKFMPHVYRKTEVITVSPSSKAEILLHKLTKKDPHIVYNGVDLKICKPGKKSKVPTVLYLGRLTTAKSVHVLIHSAKQIINNLPQVRFIIAGDGPARHYLEKLVIKLNLQSFVTFTGKVTQEEKIKLYQEAWVFVNPSLIEGWGITTIEANACGTPVVASNVAGLRDAVHNPHSGFLVPYGKVDEFVLAITKLLTSTATRKRMSNESIDWASKFDWNKSAHEAILKISGKNI